MTDEEYEKRCEPFRKAKKEFEEQEQKRREEWLKECEKEMNCSARSPNICYMKSTGKTCVTPKSFHMTKYLLK